MAFRLICPQWVLVSPLDTEKSKIDRRSKSGSPRRAYLPAFRLKVQLNINEDNRRDAGGTIGGSQRADWVGLARTSDFRANNYTPTKGDKWEPEDDIAGRTLYLLSTVPTAAWAQGVMTGVRINLANKEPSRKG